MPVDSTHSSYDETLPVWIAARDVAKGERAVKAKGMDYLPMLGGQEDSEYAAFKARASFYNATGRTIDGLSGMVFRKPPELHIPGGMDDFLEDVTLGGIKFQGFAENVLEEVLTVGRNGLLVEYPSDVPDGLTKAQAERLNLRPFWSMYKAESIIDWRVGRVGGKTVLTHVRLHETVGEPEDEFTEREIEQIRVLDLDGEGLYRQRLFRREDASKPGGNKRPEWVQYGDDILPTMSGKRMDYIPFIFFGPQDTSPRVSRPPLIDLVDKNLDHYRMDADYKHSLHFIAAGSTRWVKGVLQEEIDNGVFDAVGPTALLASTSPDAEFGISEPGGGGIPTQRQALQDAEVHMAALGARMLAPEKKAAEAAETAVIRREGESSVLASLATAVSIGLTRALEITRDWLGLAEEALVVLNTDYVAQGMSAEDVRALTEALQDGGISQLSYIEALQRGEVLREDLTPEEEIERILGDQAGSLTDEL